MLGCLLADFSFDVLQNAYFGYFQFLGMPITYFLTFYGLWKDDSCTDSDIQANVLIIFRKLSPKGKAVIRKELQVHMWRMSVLTYTRQ